MKIEAPIAEVRSPNKKTAMKKSSASAIVRLKISIRGAVQGVGFRPFIFRLADELNLAGGVNNSSQGVFIEVEGTRKKLETFLLRLDSEKPPRSSIQSLETTWLDAVALRHFVIRPSENTGGKSALVLPDIATCSDCLSDIFDPKNRRHLYPFTNCTNCGPRFSIIEALPYDRPNTSMKEFAMCSACRREYENPADRRFHAQPNACPVCGPRLELQNPAGEKIFSNHDALLAAAAAIRRGKIIAVKDIGGFHLMVDARNEKAVQKLRKRKHREEKPFALLFPSIKSARAVCQISPLEERLLRSPEAPIVLLRRRRNATMKCRDESGGCAFSVAPGNPNLGVMLPSNPLQHLLITELKFPIVATSGNLSDEPICISEFEALDRLAGIADLFLVHNRPIIRHVDDSIVRVILDREMILRRARGFAPLPVQITDFKSPIPNILAVGAHLKNSVALAAGENIFISQHIGDLETEAANNAFRRVIADFENLYAAKPEVVAADLHPDYFSTQFANESQIANRVGVQHHVAHVWSCLAENEISPPALGVSWDGTGYGNDGTIWGGEFFCVGKDSCDRVAHLRPFRLPGGNKAAREPRRTAIGLLHEIFGDAAFEMTHLPPLQNFSAIESSAIKGMLQRKLNSPLTSSAGRLFDAIASLVALRQTTRFEGQAAMELEFALSKINTDERYELSLIPHHSSLWLDWQPLVEAILADIKNGNVSIGKISAKFHNALAEGIVAVAKRFGLNRVALSGGCFQNRYLTERVVHRLRQENFKPYWHQRVPSNDGGIALGQIVAAIHGHQS